MKSLTDLTVGETGAARAMWLLCRNTEPLTKANTDFTWCFPMCSSLFPVLQVDPFLTLPQRIAFCITYLSQPLWIFMFMSFLNLPSYFPPFSRLLYWFLRHLAPLLSHCAELLLVVLVLIFNSLKSPLSALLTSSFTRLCPPTEISVTGESYAHLHDTGPGNWADPLVGTLPVEKGTMPNLKPVQRLETGSASTCRMCCVLLHFAFEKNTSVSLLLKCYSMLEGAKINS